MSISRWRRRWRVIARRRRRLRRGRGPGDAADGSTREGAYHCIASTTGNAAEQCAGAGADPGSAQRALIGIIRVGAAAERHQCRQARNKGQFTHDLRLQIALKTGRCCGPAYGTRCAAGQRPVAECRQSDVSWGAPCMLEKVRPGPIGKRRCTLQCAAMQGGSLPHAQSSPTRAPLAGNRAPCSQRV
jgi:hypothetical protein